MNHELITFLDSIFSFDQEALQQLSTHLKSLYFRKGEHVYRKHIDPEYIYLVEKGLLRMYQVDDISGHEINRSFFAEKECVYCCADPDQGGSIQALENTHVFGISLSQASTLAHHQTSIQQYIQKVMTDDWQKKEITLHMLSQPKAEDRYRVLESRFHSLLLRVPLYHLASFLNITPVHLSRIRKSNDPIIS